MTAIQLDSNLIVGPSSKQVIVNTVEIKYIEDRAMVYDHKILLSIYIDSPSFLVYGLSFVVERRKESFTTTTPVSISATIYPH